MPHFDSPEELAGVVSHIPNDGDIFVWISVGAESVLVLVNLLPILVVTCIKSRNDRHSIDRLIVALSITDILSVIIPTPFALTSYLKQHWFGGNLTCDIYQLSSVCFQMASMCLITLMSADRCWTLKQTLLFNYSTSDNGSANGAIMSPSLPTLTSSPKRHRITSSTLVHVLTIYAICFLFSCLPLLGLAPSAFSLARNSCQSWISAPAKDTHTHVFSICFLGVGFTNLLLTLTVNVLLLKMLWKLSGVIPWSQIPSGKSNSVTYPTVLGSDIAHKSVKQITNMTVMVTIVFYIAWMPALILILLERLTSYSHQSALYYVLLCTTLTGLINPFVYAIFSKSYSTGYRHIGAKICQFITGCPIKPKGFTALSFSGARTNSSLSGIISFSRSNSHTSNISSHHHHHSGNNQDNSSTDSSSQLSLCYSGPGGCEMSCTSPTTQLDALTCTQQKNPSIYCTPNGCSSVVDLELDEKVYGGCDISSNGMRETNSQHPEQSTSSCCKVDIDDGKGDLETETTRFENARLMILTD